MSIPRVLPGPKPDIIAPLSVEQAYAAALAAMQAAAPDLVDAPRESDPLHKLLMVQAWHYTRAIGQANDAVRAVMPHLASGADLDAIALRAGVTRLMLDPGDPQAIPPRPPVYESDARLLQRYYGAWDRLGQSGSEGLYTALALEVPGVRDVAVDTPEPCDVVVTVLGWSGLPDAATLDAVRVLVTDRERRTMGDRVTVRAAEVVDYAITATLSLLPNADAPSAVAAAREALTAYTTWSEEIGHTPLGRDITLAGLIAAAMVPGVRDVAIQPVGGVACARHQAARCTGIVVEVAS